MIARTRYSTGFLDSRSPIHPQLLIYLYDHDGMYD